MGYSRLCDVITRHYGQRTPIMAQRRPGRISHAGTFTTWQSCYVHVACNVLLKANISINSFQVNFCSMCLQFDVLPSAQLLMYSVIEYISKMWAPWHFQLIKKKKKMFYHTSPKDSGTEANPDSGSVFICLSLPTMVTMTRRTETGETSLDRGRPADSTYSVKKVFGQSYLLYHLHCRIAVDCCLTSTLYGM